MSERTTAVGLIVLLAVASVMAQGGSQLAGTVRDADGFPMPAILVEISSPALAEAVRPVATDSRGRYRFAGLPPGEYSIAFTLIGFWTERREGIRIAALPSLPVDVRLYGGGESERQAGAPAGAHLTGTVLDQMQGVMPGVTLTLTGPATRTTTSDPDGQFSFTDLPAGDYELRAALEGFATTVRNVSFAPDTRLTLQVELSVGGASTRP